MVGFGDESWSELTYPPLTILRRDVKGLSAKAVGMLFEKINTGVAISHDCYADVELVVRKSTKMLDNGPFGDKAAAPDSVVLTKRRETQTKVGRDISGLRSLSTIPERLGQNCMRREFGRNLSSSE